MDLTGVDRYTLFIPTIKYIKNRYIKKFVCVKENRIFMFANLGKIILIENESERN